jgi:hypothetical protein
MSLHQNLSHKMESHLNCARDASQKSKLVHKHGCIITKNGKPVIIAYNHNRSYVKGIVCCSIHAELYAINRWFRTFLRGKKKQCLL